MWRTTTRFGTFLVVALILFGAGGSAPANADSGARTYTFLIASGFLCGLDPSACPAISRASNSDTIEMTGGGTFTIHPKSVLGGGTFSHKDPGGGMIASGTWVANELVSFDGYGTGGGFPSDFEGGKVLMKIVLLPSAGGAFDAVLWIDCLIGKFPAGAAEGVRLNVPGGVNFNREVSGFTLYIRLN